MSQIAPRSSLPASVTPVSDVASELRRATWDALVVVGPAPLSKAQLPPAVLEVLGQAERVDATLAGERAAIAVVPARDVPGGRLVVSTTGALASWELDVRTFAAAAAAGVARAVSAGAKRPLVLAHAPAADDRFARAAEVSLLGALAATWEPLELRTTPGAARVEAIGIALGSSDAEGTVARIVALERGRVVARDICGTEPEQMAPEGVARYCESAFEGTAVRVEVTRDAAQIARDYPLLGAVARASIAVGRHHPRIVRLAYQGEGPIARTILLAGKGVTYDTGGADLKTDGHMAGMSRDKGGAAAVAGLFRVLAERKPKGVRVIGLLGAVRNSVGSDAYVSDEIVRSRAGVRVRIGNTDAEGRLVLADLLAALRGEPLEGEVAAFSIATLTGHAAIAVGPYTALVETGSARKRGIGDAIQRAGDALGDPIERSTIRPEDYAFIAAKSPAEDVISCNSLPSSRTPRGHQFPAAFLDVVSGLRAANKDAAKPIAFVHVDIAGSAVEKGSWQTGIPTGAPVLAMAEGLSLL